MIKKSVLLFGLLFILCSCKNENAKKASTAVNPVEVEKDRVLLLAAQYLHAKPVTVTDSVSSRSPGGIHDFYSEGDYWWPDPEHPDGPYMRKDGLTNPDNFTADRQAVIRFNQIAGALTSAYLVTGNKTYLERLIPHFNAWFVNENTRMNPNLNYGQAISGRVSGRGIGIIDTVHFIEVAKAIEISAKAGVIAKEDLDQIKNWFQEYLNWLTTSNFGIAERDNGNNHSVTWAEQVAAFAHLISDEKLLNFCRKFYKETLLPEQMDSKGAFPRELARTKPYGYSIFVLDAMTTLCQILATPEEDLFNYTTPDGKNIGLGLKFLYPYLKDKSSWPYAKDVLHWEEWPVQQPALLFGGLAFDREDYLQLWKALPADYSSAEVTRNMPVKYPLLWLN